MRRNLEVAEDARGHYSTDLFTNEAVNIINRHGTKNSSLFLYLSHLAPHAGNYENPLQAPQESMKRFTYIRDHDRRTYAGIAPIRTIIYRILGSGYRASRINIKQNQHDAAGRWPLLLHFLTTLHVSGASCTHHQEYNNCICSLWHKYTVRYNSFYQTV